MELETTIQDLNGQKVRTLRVDGTDYVSMTDFCQYLQRLLGKIVELSAVHQDHIANLTTYVDVLCEVFAQRDPELCEALLQAAQQRRRLV